MLRNSTRIPLGRLARARTRATLALALLLLALTGTAQASVSQLEKNVTARAYAELGVTESPAGSNHVDRPYNINASWCASFINWVLESNGIDSTNPNNRGTFNVNVAKAWSVYGPRGGGLGRRGTDHNAMPGDLLIDNYDGTATTGGHIAMVIGPHPAGLPYVWTVGGNEGDAVRLQKKSLDTNSRYLVTLAEFRSRRVDLLREYNTRMTDIGDVYFKRYYSAGARMQVTRVTLSSGVSYTSTTSPTLHASNYRTWSPSGTYFADQVFATDGHAWVDLIQGDSTTASLTVAPVAVDASRATSSSSTG